MITETITYLDFPDADGSRKEITETLHFHIDVDQITSRLDLVDELQEIMTIVDSRNGKRDLATAEVQKILDFVKTIIKMSYGERDVDAKSGRQIFDRIGRWESFSQSAAYDKFLMHLFRDAEKAFQFVLRVLPQEFIEQSAKEQGIKMKEDGSLDIDDAKAKEIFERAKHPMAMVRENAPVAPPAEPEEDRITMLKRKKPSDLSKDELIELMAHQNQLTKES